MKKTYLTPQTRKKINKIADVIFSKYGNEAPHLSNIKTIIKSTVLDLCKEGMEGMSHYTLYVHHDEIIKQLNFLIQQDLSKRTLLEFSQSVDNHKMISVEDDIQSITITYTSGRKRIFVEGELTEQKQEQQPKVWMGLFDYVDEKNVFIRRDKRYIGCNVKSLESILKHFKSLLSFKEWCIWARDAALNPKFHANIDTPKDIEFLNVVISAIEKRQQNNWL